MVQYDFSFLPIRQPLCFKANSHHVPFVVGEVTYFPGRDACIDRIAGQSSRNDRARTDHAIPADISPGQNDAVQADKNVAADNNRLKDIDPWVFFPQDPNATVMGDKFDTGGDGHMVSKRDQIGLGPEGIWLHVDESATVTMSYPDILQEKLPR